MASSRRQSSRKSCPMKRNVELVIVRTNKTPREVFGNVEVKLQNCTHPLASPTNETSLTDREEKLSPEGTRRKERQDITSEEDETLLDIRMKKYPSRSRTPLHTSNNGTATEVVKHAAKSASGKENSSKTPTRTLSSRKSVGRKVTYAESEESSCSEDERAVKKPAKKKALKKRSDSDPDWGQEERESTEEEEHEASEEATKDGSKKSQKVDDSKSYPIRKRKSAGNTQKDSSKPKSNTVKKKKSVKLQEPESEETSDEDVPMKGEVDDPVEMESASDDEYTKVSAQGSIPPDGDDEDDADEENCQDEQVSQMDDDTEDANSQLPRVLTANALDGQSIFGFVTPKRKDALAKIAQDVRDSAKQSSKKSAKKSTSKLASETPKSSKKGSKASTSGNSTTKMKNKVTLLRTLAANESDDDEDDDEEEDLSESEESDEDGAPATSKKESRAKKDNNDILDQYFEVHGKTTSVTSDKTLAKLKNPKMDQKELLQHLKEAQSSHVKEIMKLHAHHQKHYKTWMLNLHSGFNVLVYGFGSKHMLLDKFRKTMLQNHEHVVVNGFFPSIQLKQVLKIITEEIMGKETVFKNIMEHYKYITKEYNTGTSGKLFLVIHNIDGHMLRSQNVQTALAHLASSCNIHLIASIDHINAPLIWDQNRASAFNWLWYDATTFEAYAEETSYENSLMVQQSGTLALSSLKHVLHSLTSNSKGIFKVLADYHLDNEDNSSYQGMSFGDLYQRCRERFLVNSDLTLRGQLTEFRDHKLVKSKKGVDGVEYLAIALDCATLRTYLEEEES